ncbi:MAG: hypothetical protein K5891_10635 [Lachnospiraceae bacterium]|nr:hypothetical protein [Lachnospiraceae bacterium]
MNGDREIQVSPELGAVVVVSGKEQIRRGGRQKPASPGNIGDLMTVGLFMIAMAVLMIRFLDCSALLSSKSEVSQLCRQYILRMETCGYLNAGDEAQLLSELEAAGVAEADLTGTTRSPVPFGTVITLRIRGVLGEENAFEEKRTSTAKY